MLLEPEQLFLTNYLWMPGEDRLSVDDGLSVFKLPPFHLNGWQGYELMMDAG